MRWNPPSECHRIGDGIDLLAHRNQIDMTGSGDLYSTQRHGPRRPGLGTVEGDAVCVDGCRQQQDQS
jgi:hypothetical protein